MWRKLLIIHLLLVLALLPVAQAISPAASTAGTDTLMQDMADMGCGHIDPIHCTDFDSCTPAGNSNCDTKIKSTLLLPEAIEYPARHVYNAHLPADYSFQYAELFLRPPRNI